MKISKWVLGLVVVMILWACGPRVWTKEEINDKLLTLTLHIQAGADEKALDMVTLAEKNTLADESGTAFDASKFKLLKKMRYSMLLKEDVTLDEYGKIIGVESVLDKMAGGVNAELKPREVGVEGYVSENDILASEKVEPVVDTLVVTNDSTSVPSDSSEVSTIEEKSMEETVEPELEEVVENDETNTSEDPAK